VLSALFRALGRFDLAGRYLARATVGRVRAGNASRPTIFLSGPSRAGKSILAQALAQHHGYHHVELDIGVPHIYRMRDASARAKLRTAFYESLISRCTGGCVIEGHDLILVDRWYDSGMLGYEPIDIPGLARLAARCDGLPVIVGCADVPSDAVGEAIRSASSWMAAESPAYIETYAAELVEASAKLRDLSANAGVRYIDLDPRGLPVTASIAAARILGREQ